ncbi:hypothetical protein HID58_073893 [Brassica napus]|uniref:Uncharacterized protein n=1 Tax=Brassica napus TaxID=3708 RepID=A0ABQ7YF43_BRANA|nr:hypothetical protein HID58_073893 [Brassica napus]
MEPQHDDPEFVTESHHQMLCSLLGSKEDAHGSMVYSYRHGFSGFSAKLTKSQAKKIANLPEVVHVIPDSFYKMKTTRTWDYLGLSASSPKNLLNETNMGEQIIIGIIDTGVWPESEVFNDDGIGSVPSHWKGGCQSGEMFNSSHCNKKLIGAKYFINGFLEENKSFNSKESLDFISPRDLNGHGTHVATIAAGSYVQDISYKGLAGGVVRGGAPRARIAMYKGCWYLDDLDITTCSSADILKAMDEAIHDGVDVLSLSLGSVVPLHGETDIRDGISTGAFHAVLKGITVVCAGGNSGPEAQTVTNTAPWIVTVSATTLDRSFPTPITLGNNKVILGQAMYTGPELGFTSLVYPEDPGNSNETFSGFLVFTKSCNIKKPSSLTPHWFLSCSTCEDLSLNSNATMVGKVVLCFTTSSSSGSVSSAAGSVKKAGGLGVIIARHPGSDLEPCLDDFPCVSVDYELGTNILLYIRSTGSPVLKIQPSTTLVGQPVGTKVATFSSRGPNSIAPAILKNVYKSYELSEVQPDIAAPGASILAATTTNTTLNNGGFIMLSGTSMAAPVISGVVALLKALHPDWSPAAIRSAIVTTEGWSRKLADPFDYGGGLVNPEKAVKPDLKEEVTLTRTVTNVGPLNPVYKVKVEPPLGIQVTVVPKKLVFNSKTKTLSYQIRVSTRHKINTGFYFGSLTWSDSVHNVIIPLSVRTQILQNYYDEN